VCIEFDGNLPPPFSGQISVKFIKSLQHFQ